MKEPRGGGEAVLTSTVLSTEPSKLCAPIHHRMPVIVDGENWPAWLGEVDMPQYELLSKLCPYSPDFMRAYGGKHRVGNAQTHQSTSALPCSELRGRRNDLLE